MKQLFVFVAAALISSAAISQARTSTAEFQKIMQPAVVTEVLFPEKTVSKAIEDKMEKMGYKGKDTKGFLTYKGVRIPSIGADSYDFYFKTERKSKKEKDITVITMLVSSGYEKFISDTGNAVVINNSKTFLNTFQDVISAYDLEQQIIEQEDISTKATKKLISYTEEGQDLQKKKKKIEDDIKDNEKDQANQKAESEKQRQILETLKSKRK